jgi:streptogramin lyase
MRTVFLAAALSLFVVAPLSAQTIRTIAGTGKPENNGDRGAALKINVGDPFGAEIGPDGALYICEVRNHRVLRLDHKSGELTTVAGSGTKGFAGDDGPATKAQLNEPYEVRFDSAGNILFVEMQNHVVRKVDAKTRIISTVAGTSDKGFSGDNGPARKAQLGTPHSIALDAENNLYIADIGNHRIRKVDAKTGNITTIAGNGEKQPPVDGQPAVGKPMIGPRALCIVGDTMWIALREGHSVWRMDLKSGILKHAAGTGKRGYSGDSGPAKDAAFDGPKGIAVTAKGEICVADTENHAIRKIGADGIVTTIAGSGPEHGGYSGDDGPATAASLNRPHGICVDADGAVYIGDTLNHRVRVVK